jgi:hypothetical protein
MVGGFSCDSGIESEGSQGFDGMVSAWSERTGSTAATLGIGKAAARDGVTVV